MRQAIWFKQRKPGSSSKQSFVKRILRLANLPRALEASFPLLICKLKLANKKLKKVTEQGPELHGSFLFKLDQVRALQFGTTKAAKQSKRLCIAKQKHQGQVAKKVWKQQQEEVTKVFITWHGIKETCDTKPNVEQACQEEGLSKFNQTCLSPPIQPDVTELFGFAAEKPKAKEVLRGTFDCERIHNKYLRKLLQYLHLPNKVLENWMLSSVVTLKGYIAGWKKQKKTTASVESQLSFADHIAAIKHEGLSNIDRLASQIPVCNGFAPGHRLVIKDFQILKKSGLWDVEAMRIIQLMTAVFNMCNKWLGCKGLANTEKFDLLPPKQAGSRKWKQAAYSTLKKSPNQ